MSGLVTHYSTNGLDSACGRSPQKLVSTVVTDDVSCKSCQRSLARPAPVTVAKSPSLAELRKAARAAREPVVSVTPQGTVARPASRPAPAPAASAALPARFSVKAAWAARLAEQGNGNRAPRGKVKKGRA